MTYFPLGPGQAWVSAALVHANARMLCKEWCYKKLCLLGGTSVLSLRWLAKPGYVCVPWVLAVPVLVPRCYSCRKPWDPFLDEPSLDGGELVASAAVVTTTVAQVPCLLAGLLFCLLACLRTCLLTHRHALHCSQCWPGCMLGCSLVLVAQSVSGRAEGPPLGREGKARLVFGESQPPCWPGSRQSCSNPHHECAESGAKDCLMFPRSTNAIESKEALGFCPWFLLVLSLPRQQGCRPSCGSPKR